MKQAPGAQGQCQNSLAVGAFWEKVSCHTLAAQIMQDHVAQLCWLLELRAQVGNEECGGIHLASAVPPYLWPLSVRFASSPVPGLYRQKPSCLHQLRTMQFRNKNQ